MLQRFYLASFLYNPFVLLLFFVLRGPIVSLDTKLMINMTSRNRADLPCKFVLAIHLLHVYLTPYRLRKVFPVAKLAQIGAIYKLGYFI